MRMYLKLFKFLALFFPLAALAQYAPVTQDVNASAVFADMQAQQNYLLQQQAAQQQAMYAQMAAQQKAAQDQMQMQSMIKLGSGLCSQMLSGKSLFGGNDTEETAHTVDDAAYMALEEEGFTTNADIDRETALQVGADAYVMAGGCDNFINKSGQLGPWGNYALAQIQSKPQSFGNNVPADLTTWCPKYPSMNKSQRDLYWVWVLMSMAASESSCNPRAENPNAPDGTAIGLFQVWKPVCPKATDLYKANQNIQCAVDLLADELQDRSTLMTPTSRGPRGTYWGPLRSDDHNKARGGDISGAQKTRALMQQYRFCK